ncbi:acetate/propionate family kinase [Pedobacter fastidiosus]|uniref:Acetate kinase n=1 Tax=Pedobacter fastidiosus TaxID=2765361 RepID=A0ABR7KZB2_9SPHI|nr:acetate/propionate family kinase [Pedobacter fastidiosus]MBC6113107.1 acetate/propionate family kinase [Pedobacter fastidiosus]
MKVLKTCVLVINGGSSSIKFSLYNIDKKLKSILSGQIKRIGLDNPEFTVTDNLTHEKSIIKIDTTTFKEITEVLIEWLKAKKYFEKIACIGHRIVHGMDHKHPEVIDDNLLKELRKIMEYDPDHLPAEIEMIELFRKQFPQLLQVACFDTSFHTTLPKYASTFAIPKKYYDEGIKRYGFHGISYSYLLNELRKKNEVEAKGKIILAHLGNGSSLAAVKKGKCIDTSMGFTPAGGVVMSTRTGDLDPGVAWYLQRKSINAEKFNDLINHQSGLLGISGYSSDMEDLLQHEGKNKDAALAIEIFCYQIKKYIGAYTASLSGLDVLIFSGGIGENAPVIRSRICKGFNYLGMEIDERKNKKNNTIISTKKSKVKVYVIPTNEEFMIAESTSKLYQSSTKDNNQR